MSIEKVRYPVTVKNLTSIEKGHYSKHGFPIHRQETPKEDNAEEL
jgi:hypothetical protein